MAGAKRTCGNVAFGRYLAVAVVDQFAAAADDGEMLPHIRLQLRGGGRAHPLGTVTGNQIEAVRVDRRPAPATMPRWLCPASSLWLDNRFAYSGCSGRRPDPQAQREITAQRNRSAAVTQSSSTCSRTAWPRWPAIQAGALSTGRHRAVAMRRVPCFPVLSSKLQARLVSRQAADALLHQLADFGDGKGPGGDEQLRRSRREKRAVPPRHSETRVRVARADDSVIERHGERRMAAQAARFANSATPWRIQFSPAANRLRPP